MSSAGYLPCALAGTNTLAPAHTHTHTRGRHVAQMKTRLLSDDRWRTGTYSMLILSAGSSVTSPIARQTHLMSLLFFSPSTPLTPLRHRVCSHTHTSGHTVACRRTAELVDANVAVREGSTNGSRLDLISCGQSITLSQAKSALPHQRGANHLKGWCVPNNHN